MTLALEVSCLTIAVVPGREGEAHVSLDHTAHGLDVVAAVSLKDDLVRVLGKSRADAPKVLVAIVGEELGLDSKGSVSVNHRAARAVGTTTVPFLAFDGHVVLALRDSIASTVGARMHGGVEAVWVGLHDVDAGAHWVVVTSVTLATELVVDLDGVDTGNAATVDCAEIDGVLDGSSADERRQSVRVAIVGLVLDEEGVVVGDTH